MVGEKPRGGVQKQLLPGTRSGPSPQAEARTAVSRAVTLALTRAVPLDQCARSPVGRITEGKCDTGATKYNCYFKEL